jgi:hypothetical protein
MLCKKFRSKYSEIKKLMTSTPVGTNGTFSSIPKKGTSGFPKKFFLPDSLLGGLREYYTKKWLKNSKKNSLVLAGFNSFRSGAKNSTIQNKSKIRRFFHLLAKL